MIANILLCCFALFHFVVSFHLKFLGAAGLRPFLLPTALCTLTQGLRWELRAPSLLVPPSSAGPLESAGCLESHQEKTGGALALQTDSLALRTSHTCRSLHPSGVKGLNITEGQEGPFLVRGWLAP